TTPADAVAATLWPHVSPRGTDGLVLHGLLLDLRHNPLKHHRRFERRKPKAPVWPGELLHLRFDVHPGCLPKVHRTPVTQPRSRSPLREHLVHVLDPRIPLRTRSPWCSINRPRPPHPHVVLRTQTLRSSGLLASFDTTDHLPMLTRLPPN